MSTRLPSHLAERMRLPLVAAPMNRISHPALVVAACAAGVVGGFPTANARSGAELDEWLAEIDGALPSGAAPYAANLILRSPRLDEDVEVLARHGVEIVITSVGSPARVLDPLHAAGVLLFADVASLRHARRAVEAGADGLVLLTAGAGGQTGWLNPLAFVRAVRAFYDGPVILAGGVSDGHALHAARVLGCDLAYMGTAFIATRESRAKAAYKDMLVASDLDDVVLTRAFTGLPTSMLEPSIRAAGLDPGTLEETVTPADAATLYGHGGRGPRRWTNVWSAGHSVSGVAGVDTVADLVERTARQYAESVAAWR